MLTENQRVRVKQSVQIPNRWRSEEAEGFHSLKKALISSAVLAFSDWNNT